MAEIKISIINESTLLTDEEIGAVVPALQTQVSEHFGPAWGVDAQLTFVARGQKPEPGSWWLAILDDSDQAGELAYHETTDEGLPCGKLFARTDLDNHLSWSVTISHELLEMLVDPDINLTTFVQDTAKTGKLYSYEVCDPVADDQFGYLIDTVRVSDFVLPCYFEPHTSTADGKYDYCGHLSSPVPALLSGGYLGQFDVSNTPGWTYVTAATEGQPHRGHLRIHVPGGRSSRRRQLHTDWRKSDPRLVPMRTASDQPPFVAIEPGGGEPRLVPMGPGAPRLVPMDHGAEPRLVPMDHGGAPRLVPMKQSGASPSNP
jgi:hypothetical protein